MKSIKNIGNYLTRGTLIVAVAGLTLLANSAVAQEKGGERMMKLLRLNTAADVQKVEAGDTIVMSCPKCKDTWVKVVQPMGKGGRQETANIQRHECPGCDTKIVTEGVGKQAKSVVKHTCKQCGSEDMSCCVMKKGAGPTPGMDEHKGHQH
ncbi:MAG: hypothetical protein MUF81_06295 [Verrucomicrobia bacterium]|jgi:hypothetical protein|nr:hypothetical protein [Verrucomicrobiota bacterium]